MSNLNMRTAGSGDIIKLKSLWRECFGDTPEYADFVFHGLIKPSCALICELNGEIPSMMFFEPFILKTPEKEFSGAYIYGVATSQKSRGLGLSTKLLDYAHSYLTQSGYTLSILVPASESLFDFYGKRGYELFSDICVAQVNADELTGDGGNIRLTPVKLESLFDLREAYFRDSRGFVSWSNEYLAYTGSECERFGGEILHIESNMDKGYAVCYKSGDTVHIKEIALPRAMLAPAMVAIHKRLGALTYRLRFRADFNTALTQSLLPFSMIKWYDSDGKTALTGNSPAYIAFVLD